MFRNYLKYLNYIDCKLAEFFELQKDYIKCSKGCALCCKKAEFPFSLIEFRYLISGFMNLEKEQKVGIIEKAVLVIKEKKEFQGDKFLYDCPFLVENICSVYKYRGIVCRTFGLAVPNKNESTTKVPFCYQFGLNYSNVVDERTNTISLEKFKQTGLKIAPAGFNIGYNMLTNEVFEKKYNFQFGKKLPLIDWLQSIN